MKLEFLDNELFKNEAIEQLLVYCPLQVLKSFEYVEYKKENDFLLHQEQNYDDTYILLDGTVEIFLISSTGRKVVLDIYQKAGAFIGEQEAILNVPYSASVRNITPVRLLKFTNQTFIDWVDADHHLAKSLIKNQCAQVYHLANQTARYTLYSAKEQVAIAILRMHRRNQAITRNEIISSVAMTPRHVNRILADLADKGIISIGHSLIKVLEIDKLTFYGES